MQIIEQVKELNNVYIDKLNRTLDEIKSHTTTFNIHVLETTCIVRQKGYDISVTEPRLIGVEYSSDIILDINLQSDSNYDTLVNIARNHNLRIRNIYTVFGAYHGVRINIEAILEWS